MSDFDRFRYDGKRALVVGGATGMGAAAAQTVQALGGRVVVMDHAPVAFDVERVIAVDLRQKEAIEGALNQLDGDVDALFAAAGVADGTSGLMKINFISHRHIIENLVADGRLRPGGAICFISSVGGLGWENNLSLLVDFLDSEGFDAADHWVEAHVGTDNYGFSKQAINCYVARESFPLLKRGIRINAICPGPTDTPLARANADVWLSFAQDYRDATNMPHLLPAQMADVMCFLNSEAASGISGVNILVDAGHVMSSLTGSFAPGRPIIEMLMGMR